MIRDDKFYMNEAFLIAKTAEERGDVPIGAVVVRRSDGEIVGRGMNDKEANRNPIGHAEINAIKDACDRLSSHYLIGCTIYVTLEPCPMCAGALVNARIDRVVYAAPDPKAGAFGSVISLTSYPLNHKPEIKGGVCADEALTALRKFFSEKRKKQ